MSSQTKSGSHVKEEYSLKRNQRRFLSFRLAGIAGQDVIDDDYIIESGLRKNPSPYPREKLPPKIYIKYCKVLNLHWLARKKLVRKGTVRLLVQGGLMLNWLSKERFEFFKSRVNFWCRRRINALRKNYAKKTHRDTGSLIKVPPEKNILRLLGKVLPLNLGLTLRLHYDDLRLIVCNSQLSESLSLADLC